MHKETAKDIADALETRDKRIAELEAEVERLNAELIESGFKILTALSGGRGFTTDIVPRPFLTQTGR